MGYSLTALLPLSCGQDRSKAMCAAEGWEPGSSPHLEKGNNNSESEPKNHSAIKSGFRGLSLAKPKSGLYFMVNSVS